MAAYGAERRIVARVRSAADPFAIDPQWRPPGVGATVTSHDGTHLHAVVAGSGTPLVLSHGVMLSMHVWSRMFVELRDRGFQVIAYDQRGLGQTDKPEGPYTMADYGDDAAAVMEALGWQSAHVLGVVRSLIYTSNFFLFLIFELLFFINSATMLIAISSGVSAFILIPMGE